MQKLGRCNYVEFFIHSAQAEEAGFKSCLRCRPETAPGSPAWIGTSATKASAEGNTGCNAQRKGY